MTMITIDLTPDMYERLQREAQKRGQHEQATAEAILTRQLLAGDAESQQPLVVYLLPLIRSLVSDKPLALFEVEGTRHNGSQLQDVFDDSEAEDEEDGSESWDMILQAIDVHRSSNRPLFTMLEPT